MSFIQTILIKLKSFCFQRKEEKERANRYTNVMRSLVWRYVSAMHRKIEDSPVTEDDVNEVKMEISAMRYELLEVFEKNGMDVSSANRKDKSECHVSSARSTTTLMTSFHNSFHQLSLRKK